MGTHKTLFSHNRHLCLAFLLSSMLLLGGIVSDYVFAQAGDMAENAGASAAGAVAAAGSYTEDPVVQAQKSKFYEVISPIFRAGKFNPGQQQEFDAYYNTYALARWTKLSTLGDLRAYRKELSNNLQQARAGQVHDYLNELVLRFMEERAKSDKYHPAVRYNAMLTIGDLNAVEGFPTTPLEAALPVLLAAVNDDKQIEPVKIAALIGINRHLSWGVSNPQATSGANNPQVQNQVLNSMLKLAAGADSAEGSEAGRQWIRKQAVEILGLLGNLGNDNQVVQMLTAIVGDKKVPFITRCAAAEALGKLKYAGSGLNAVDLLKALGQLMLDTCQEELKNLNKDANLPNFRRRLKTCLGAVINGLNGPLEMSEPKGVKQLAKDPAQKTYLDELHKILDTSTSKETDLLKDLDNAALEEKELQNNVQNYQTRLKIWLEKKI